MNMAKYTVHEAKTHLSRLLQKASTGEEVIITNRNEPVARIVPVKPNHRQWGSLKGKIKFAENWDAPIEDFRDYLK